MNTDHVLLLLGLVKSSLISALQPTRLWGVWILLSSLKDVCVLLAGWLRFLAALVRKDLPFLGVAG